ncbi:extracellular solute-binding protein [Streptomyces sp. 3MP-14]|uniref:Extracellular solute-binding protein n=2 Tax=Streptomyces TaxID=1883 RepID=A0A5N6AB82_9ACTN|nr:MULTISPECIES: extracellular solute-binding protein [Streptomyces]KAB8165911.1 extracellular solute-binding protein [Streptomyces mimosae]KAB8176300.1 extracellular solute-binding protein [Streptomyces sp. 3MP-14]
MALTACGGGSSDGDDGPVTLDVWLMRDSVSQEFEEEFVTAFEDAHPGIDVNVQIQEWNGIGERVTAALASNDAPDVIEVGNTQVAQYAASGGVTDLTDRVADLGGEDWLPGLAEPGAVDGRQYGIPYYAANRVVIYRTDLFEAAGVDPAELTTRDAWLAATERLNEPEGQQGIYLPGQNWYALSGFIWDEGGDLAVEAGDGWEGALDTPEALAGMDFYQQLQALGEGPRDSDEAEPPQVEVFAGSEVAQIIAVPGGANLAVERNPELEGKIGFFPIPGKTPDTPGAVFTGGSDLIIPAASQDPDAAFTFVEELTGDRWQVELSRAMSYVPNRTSLADEVADDPGVAAMAVGAANGQATPNTPEWAAVEAENPIKDYMTAVLTGSDPAEAAREASEVITRALNP